MQVQRLRVAIGLALSLLMFGTITRAHPLDKSEKSLNERSSGIVSDRLERERRSLSNPYVVSTHKQNYVLPVSYTSSLNSDVYEQINEDIPEYLNSEEVKFQLSLKVQLNEGDLLFSNDALFAGFTLEAWWQLYSKDVSSPFRETNYQPEVFYAVPLGWKPWGSSTSLVFGLVHQFGRSGGDTAYPWAVNMPVYGNENAKIVRGSSVDE